MYLWLVYADFTHSTKPQTSCTDRFGINKYGINFCNSSIRNWCGEFGLVSINSFSYQAFPFPRNEKNIHLSFTSAPSACPFPYTISCIRVSIYASLEPGHYLRWQAAPRRALPVTVHLARIHAELPILAHETEAACRARTTRDRKLLHVLEHPRQPHDLYSRFPALHREIQHVGPPLRPRPVCCPGTYSGPGSFELPFTQLGKLAPLVHAHAQRRRLGERQLRVQLVPVELVEVEHRARSHLDQGILRNLRPSTDDVDSRRYRRRRRSGCLLDVHAASCAR